MKPYAPSILSLKNQSFFALILLPVMATSMVLAQAESPLLEYQAEDYTAINGLSKATNHAGFTGDGFMDFGGNGTWMEWNNVNVGSASTVNLNFRYANRSSSDRQAAVFVNGINTGNVAFASTGSWSSWEVVSHTVTLSSASNTIRVQANTSSGGPNLDKMEIVIESSPNASPVITSTPITRVDENTAYSYSMTATDTDVGDALIITVPVKPNWLIFDAIDTLSGTPTNANVGDHTVEIVATDSFGATDTQSFTITVYGQNNPENQIFDAHVIIQDADGSGNDTHLEVYGKSNLGPVVLDVAGGGVGPADSATYENAPFLLKHDTDGDDSADLNLAFDGDHLSTDAQPFVIQNTNPDGGISFQTGANATDRLTIAADGSVTIQGVTITDNNGSSIVTIPGAINASSVELPDGTTISGSADLVNEDQILSINGSDLTISGAGGNTIDLSSLQIAEGSSPFVTNESGIYYTSGNVGIGVTSPGEALDISGNVRVDGALILVNHAGDIPPITY